LEPSPHSGRSNVWSIRTKLQVADRKRDLAMFNLAIDSKLRGCDVVALKVEDIAPHGYTVDRATVRQKKTGQLACYREQWHNLQSAHARLKFISNSLAGAATSSHDIVG
jgi:hypothetical protein